MEIGKTLRLTLIRHPFNLKVLDRCLFDVDTRVFAIWEGSCVPLPAFVSKQPPVIRDQISPHGTLMPFGRVQETLLCVCWSIGLGH